MKKNQSSQPICELSLITCLRVCVNSLESTEWVLHIAIKSQDGEEQCAKLVNIEDHVVYSKEATAAIHENCIPWPMSSIFFMLTLKITSLACASNATGATSIWSRKTS